MIIYDILGNIQPFLHPMYVHYLRLQDPAMSGCKSLAASPMEYPLVMTNITMENHNL